MLNCISGALAISVPGTPKMFSTLTTSVQTSFALNATQDSVIGWPNVGLSGTLLRTGGDFSSSALLYEPAAEISKPSIGWTVRLNSRPWTLYSGPVRKDCRFGKPRCGANRPVCASFQVTS